MAKDVIILNADSSDIEGRSFTLKQRTVIDMLFNLELTEEIGFLEFKVKTINGHDTSVYTVEIIKSDENVNNLYVVDTFTELYIITLNNVSDLELCNTLVNSFFEFEQ